MDQLKTILFFLLSPEICFVLCLPFTSARKWWLKMIEDSDGDPHHTDGFFITVLYASVWCFRLAFIAGGYMIFGQKDLLSLIVTFLTAGSALLGVRIFKKVPSVTMKGEQ